MVELTLIWDLGATLMVAFVLGLVAFRLGLPLMFAYLVGGIAIGPFALGLVRDVENVQVLSEIGVVLLMFTLGVEFSLSQLVRMRKVAVGGGILQVTLTVAICGLLFYLGGTPLTGAIAMGFIISVSSTMIVMKTLMERGEGESLHGRVALSILIVQDLLVVGMLAILPVLPTLSRESLGPLAVTAATALGYLTIALVLAHFGIPWLMRRVAATQSRELFSLSLVGLVMAAALGTLAIGFSLALGAFVAGLVLSESEYNHEALASVLPLRDMFAILFFVSVGMLINPQVLLANAGPVVGIVLLVFVVKIGVTMGSIIVVGQHPRTAFVAAVAMGQIGEFSFLLASTSQRLKLIGDDLYSVVLASALITILVTPLAMNVSSRAYQVIAMHPWLRRWRERDFRSFEAASRDVRSSLFDHVIICGWGRTGREVGDAFRRKNIPFVAIDFDVAALESLREEGGNCIYGDAANATLLASARPESARLAIISLSDAFSTEQTLRILHELNPQLDIVVSVHSANDVEAMYKSGASEIIHPQFEVALEIIRYCLLQMGQPLQEVQSYIDGVRFHRYPRADRKGSGDTSSGLTDHYIICGGGRIGTSIAEELARAEVEYLCVEVDPDRAHAIGHRKVPVLWGDATNPRVLERAGIGQALGIIAATPSDAANLYITVTARRMRPDILIVACTTMREEEEKFIASGADHVFTPYTLGGLRMASVILRPATVDLMDAIRDENQDFHVAEIVVSRDSTLCGRTLAQSDIRRMTGANVVGVKRGESLTSNPPPTHSMQEGEVLLCVGTKEQLSRLRRLSRVGLPDPDSTEPDLST